MSARGTSLVNVGAVGAGIVSFIVLYVLLSLGLVFTLSLLPEQINAKWVSHLFKLLGLLALLLPGYAAARIAERKGVLHGFLVGLGALLVTASFMMLTFSWEGSYPEAVWLGMVKVASLAIGLGCLGGLLGDWRNRRAKG